MIMLTYGIAEASHSFLDNALGKRDAKIVMLRSGSKKIKKFMGIYI